MKRTNIFAAQACALLVFVLAGCGTSNKLQSIQLGAKFINGVPPTSQSGIYNLQGNGGTIQLQATGEYSSSKTKDLTNMVTWNVDVDPAYSQDAFQNPLLLPCAGPCADTQHGTVEFNVTGLLTSVEPATCTWIDVAPLVNGQPGPPAWFYVGDYVVTVSFEGVTSQPVYIPVASSAGNPDDIFANPPIIGNNPTELCGPTS